MAAASLNLARRPFVNRRPIARLAIVLWVLATVVLLGNVALYAHYLVESRQARQALAKAQAQVAQERKAIQELEQAPEFRDLDSYNARMDYLNQLVTARTFPWGRLFDRLGAVMPVGVRLSQLTPRIESARGKTQRDASEAGPVRLRLVGIAQSDETLYRFVDALFAAPDFDDPVLDHEARAGAGRSFSMSVTYLTSLPTASSTQREVGTASKKKTRAGKGGKS